MYRYAKYIVLISLLVLGVVAELSAQNMPERGLVRKGNRFFAKERYEQSADSYQQALLYDSTSFEAKYNLGNAMFRTERLDRAEQLMLSAATDSLRTAEERAEAYYNLGNAQFAQQKLQEALQSYRRSLTLNPDDMEAKYNYAYTKKLLEQQQNQNQNQTQNQNQNQNGDGQNDKNDQNKDNQNNQNDQNQDNNQNQNNQGDGQDDKKEQQQPPRRGMSEQQQQQLLNAIQAQEDKTQEKLDEKAQGVVIKGRKNW